MGEKITFGFVFLISLSVNSQQPWQKISDPTAKELSVMFREPPSEYGMILWWGWDGPMSDTVIRHDLDRIKAMGFRGVMLEAGYDMKAKYLSPEWFAMVKIAIEEAGKRGMKVWIEDEGKYPSGFAGGKFSMEKPDLKMRGLVVTERIDPVSGETVARKLPQYAFSAAAFNNVDNRSIVLDVSSGELNWKVPEGSWRIYIAGQRFRSSATRSVNNPTRGKDTTASLMDYLNPLATRQFLDWTHEQYKKYFGNEFGKTFMGFMGDEPDFAYTPWTPRIIEEFRLRKGYDPTPWLASFFVPQLNEEVKRVKADYWDVWSDLFRDNFFNVQAEWCRENNIDYIVHLNHEDQLPGLARSSGDFFKNMRNVAVPGVDAIWAQIWMDHVADYPKLASSAAHLYGKPRAFTESFAAFTHKPSVSQAKWVLDYQMARGINSIQVMFMSASTPRRERPQVSGSQQQGPAGQATPSPAFFLTDTFPQVAAYINRASYLLSQGRPAATIGVYFPSFSLWYGDNASSDKMLEIARILMESQFDFDFVDEQALASLLTTKGGKLVNLSRQAYSVIIIPAVSAMSSKAIARLKEFAAAGGKVIFTGEQPSLEVIKDFRSASLPGDLSWAMKTSVAEMLKLLPASDFSTGTPLPQIKYLHRKWKDADLYFIFNEKKEAVTFTPSFGTKGKKEVWDAFTGEISPFKGSSLTLGPWESKFILIK